MVFYYLIHGITKLSTTTINGYCYRYMTKDHHWPFVVHIRCIQYFTYSILSSWDNKLSLLFAYTHPFKFIAIDTANPLNAIS